MHGITINDVHINEYGLIMTDFDLPEPVVKTNIINLPGGDGMIDLTTSINGRVNYNNRKITLSFSFIDGNAEVWKNKYSELMNLYHGQVVKLIFDFDDKYFWIGRASLSSSKKFNSYSTFKMIIDVEPFKWSIYSTAENYIWDTFNFETDNANDLSEVIVNGQKDEIVLGSIVATNPIIISDKQMKVEFEGMVYQVRNGEHKYYGITLKDGENKLKFIGNGIVKINVRGGSL